MDFFNLDFEDVEDSADSDLDLFCFLPSFCGDADLALFVSFFSFFFVDFGLASPNGAADACFFGADAAAACFFGAVAAFFFGAFGTTGAMGVASATTS